MQILICKRTGTIENQRPYIIAFPVDKIQTIESQLGSENTYCKINGIEIDESFNHVIKLLTGAGKPEVVPLTLK